MGKKEKTSLKKYYAMVLGLCPTGLGVVRSLGRKGIHVIGLDFRPGGPGFYSKYVKAEICPNPYCEPDELCAFIIELGKKQVEKGIIFPTSDEFVLFLSRYRDQLSKYYAFSLPSKELIEFLLNKRWQYDMAKEHGIPCPQSFYPEQKEDIERIKNQVRYPAIIKPCYTHLWKEKGFSVKAYEVQNEQELEVKLIQIIEKKVDVIVQEMIPGPATNLYEVCSYLNQDHKPMCIFIKRKLRQFPVDMGLGSCMESIKNDKLSTMAKTLFTGIKYQGIGEIEFKQDPRDGLFKMIEINARITLQNSLADYCGINLPYIQILDLINHNFTNDFDYPEGVKWVWLEIDFESFLSLYKKNEIKIINWFLSLRKCKIDAVLSFNDHMPFIKTVIQKIIMRCSKKIQ